MVLLQSPKLPLVPAMEHRAMVVMDDADAATIADSLDFSPLTFAEEITLPLPVYKAAKTSDFDVDGLLSTPLSLHEDLASGCGGQTWPAGMVLAKHMLRYHRDDLKNSKILELGAGGGLVGLAVARGCQLAEDPDQPPLILTDQKEMLPLMERNIALNHLEPKVKPQVLNWGAPLPQDVVDAKPNIVLAADCVYFEPAFPLLLQTLSDLLVLNEDAVIYFCYKKRRRADIKFIKKAMKLFCMEKVADQDTAIFSRETIFLYSIRHKKYSSSNNGGKKTLGTREQQ